ncbi:MAG TPA: hypothetical protein VN636_02405 [Acidimicrobiia bacterium]|nr:hypothetical protein [Acidimicrobiia bacterium]
MGSKGSKARKPKHSQHLPKVGTPAENRRLQHAEGEAVLDNMGLGGASSGTRVAVTAIIVVVVVGAICGLLLLTLR